MMASSQSRGGQSSGGRNGGRQGGWDPRDGSYQSSLGGWGVKAILRDLAISWHLMRDPQVSFFLKLCLPFFAIFYWIWPVDLLVGMPFDDIAVLILASRIFVQVAPEAAVERALLRMGYLTRPKMAKDQPDREIWDIWDDDPDTINGTWRPVDDSRK